MRRRLGLAITSLAVLAFGACTFGAGDFTLVPSDEGSGATANDAGSGNGETGGQGAEAAGGSATGEGGAAASSTGGTQVGDGGAAGSGAIEYPYTCSPIGAAMTVFTANELDFNTIDEAPLLIPTGNSVVAVVPTLPAMAGGSARLYMRAIRDSGGGTLDSVVPFDLAGGRFRIGGFGFGAQSLKLLGALEAQITELEFPVTNNGTQIGQPTPNQRPTPMACTTAGGYVRDIRASYEAGALSYAVTCGLQGSDDSFSLHLAGGTPFTLAEIAPASNDPIDKIVRNYARVGAQHFMTVGAEVGPRLSVRFGAANAQLNAVHELRLSSDPQVWSSVLVRPLENGFFVFGAAFTAAEDPNDPPPLVPAELYAGSVAIAEINSLFVNPSGGNAPPAPLVNVASYTKASQLVGMDDALRLGQNVMVAGASVLPRDRVHISFVSQDGTVLAPPTEAYQAAEGKAIADHSVLLAPLGLGALLVWIEDGNVMGRTVTCLPD